MKVAIMQPYYFPYKGYYQLIAACDVFVVYDNIKYTKKGWINRNRMLLNGKDVTFSLPLKKDSDFLDVREREISPDFSADKFLNQLRGAYRRAPHFERTIEFVERVVRHPNANLFEFLHHSIVETCAHLRLSAKIVVSSTLSIDHDLKGQEKVLALCEALDANTYFNPIGGLELYERDVFAERGVKLRFLKPRLIEYEQFDGAFVPWLSIIDVLMFNDLDEVCERFLTSYETV